MKTQPSLLEQGYASAREVTRFHAKSFFFVSVLLGATRRQSAFALYTFCRRLDDVIDVAPPDRREATLARVRGALDALYAGPVPTSLELPWSPAELEAIADTIRRHQIPRAPFDDLVAGMQMDLEKTRYATFRELELYAYRVAGTVGLMISYVLGFTRPAALERAVDLGIALQLTNILRDVREDAERGRIYLPQDELAAFGLSEQSLTQGPPGERWTAFLRCQIARARAYYLRAAVGVPMLQSGRWMVRAMSSIYGGILEAIEQRGYDVFSSRAFVPKARKLLLLFAAALPTRPPRHVIEVPVVPLLAAPPPFLPDLSPAHHPTPQPLAEVAR